MWQSGYGPHFRIIPPGGFGAPDIIAIGKKMGELAKIVKKHCPLSY